MSRPAGLLESTEIRTHDKHSKAIRLIVPAPSKRKVRRCLRPDSITPSNRRIETEGGFHDQRTVFYLMDRTSQRRIRLFISSYLNRTEKYKRNLREEQ